MLDPISHHSTMIHSHPVLDFTGVGGGEGNAMTLAKIVLEFRTPACSFR